ncbi:MAG TPA: hypothetical protein VNO53_06305, partial [Steroidobacteraceae bacterium]|nr:hypothetical protein [Steroidobacteraceae bacterium]
SNLTLSANQRFRIGRPDGNIRASLVSTVRLGLMTTALTESVLGVGFGTAALTLLDLRLVFLEAARIFRGLDLRAIVESPRAALTMSGSA